MEIKAREEQFQTLCRAFEAGQMTESEFAAAVDGLGFQDGWGRTWSIGIQTGRWYYADGQAWHQADPHQAERLPFMDDQGRRWVRLEDGAWRCGLPETDRPVAPPAEGRTSPISAGPGRFVPARQMGLLVGVMATLVLVWLVLLPISSASPPTGPLPAPSPRPPLGDGSGDQGNSEDGDNGPTGPTGAIEGQVIDLSTGQPAAGFEVDVNGQIVRTDSDGSYSITGLAAGEYVVSPKLEGQGRSLQGPVYASIDGVHVVEVDLSYYSDEPPPAATVLVQPLPEAAAAAEPPPALPPSGADLSGRPLVVAGWGVLLLLAGAAFLVGGRPGIIGRRPESPPRMPPTFPRSD